MNSILWTEETKNYKSSLYSNFRTALSAYFNEELNDISSVSQVSSCKNLIVVDEHFAPHRDLLTNSKFINMINKNHVNVVIFNTEKIYNSYWTHNSKTQKKISKIKNLIQILSDAEDISLKKSPFANKQYLSNSLKFQLGKENKKNEIIFYGQVKGSAYENRRKVLSEFSKNVELPLKIIESNRSLDYEDYLNLISNYKYVLNPLGAGSFVNIRYFETLLVRSIPIQQFTNNMLDIYKELGSGYSINFSSLKDLSKSNFSNVSPLKFNYYLEDYFHDNKLNSYFV